MVIAAPGGSLRAIAAKISEVLSGYCSGCLFWLIFIQEDPAFVWDGRATDQHTTVPRWFCSSIRNTDAYGCVTCAKLHQFHSVRGFPFNV